MSNKYFINDTTLRSLGNKVRTLKGDNIQRTPAQMINALEDIINDGSAESAATLITKNVFTNGTYNASEDNADGYQQVNVNVPNTYIAADEGKVVSSGVLVSQTSKSILANGTYNTTTNNEVIVEVGNGGTPTYQSKTVTPSASQQTITPDNGYSGLSSVIINGDADLIAGNIKKDVEIFGVTGTYQEEVNSPILINKTINQNGTYVSSNDDADGYSGVTVNVPNTYAAGDEGKVVSNGALIAQTARASEITANGTYDTTTNDEVTVNVSGGGGGEEIDFYAFNFSPSSNASTALSGGQQISPLYDLRIAGIRFWARDSVCSVYISDTSGNVIASRQNAAVTAGQWNDVLFDTPVSLSKNTSYVVWGSNQSSTMQYVSTSLSSQFVIVEAAKYIRTLDTFPNLTETGSAKYGVDLIIALGTGIAEMGTLNATQNGTYNASDDDVDGYSQVVVNVSGGGATNTEVLSQNDLHKAGNISFSNNNTSIKIPMRIDFQSDTCYVYGDNTERYIQISQNNNKTGFFFEKIPASAQTLYVEGSGDASGQSWGSVSYGICALPAVTGYTQGYSELIKRWRITEGSSTAGSATDVQALRNADGGTVTYTNNLVFPRQIMTFDISAYNQECYFCFWACRSLIKLWRVWAV